MTTIVQTPAVTTTIVRTPAATTTIVWTPAVTTTIVWMPAATTTIVQTPAATTTIVWTPAATTTIVWTPAATTSTTHMPAGTTTTAQTADTTETAPRRPCQAVSEASMPVVRLAWPHWSWLPLQTALPAEQPSQVFSHPQPDFTSCQHCRDDWASTPRSPPAYTSSTEAAADPGPSGSSRPGQPGRSFHGSNGGPVDTACLPWRRHLSAVSSPVCHWVTLTSTLTLTVALGCGSPAVPAITSSARLPETLVPGNMNIMGPLKLLRCSPYLVRHSLHQDQDRHVWQRYELKVFIVKPEKLCKNKDIVCRDV